MPAAEVSGIARQTGDQGADAAGLRMDRRPRTVEGREGTFVGGFPTRVPPAPDRRAIAPRITLR